jgi:hypothetical protein
MAADLQETVHLDFQAGSFQSVDGCQGKVRPDYYIDYFSPSRPSILFLFYNGWFSATG